MLEVHSPVPLTEGENLVWGLRTKHITHFIAGFVASSPVMGLFVVIAPLLHAPRFTCLFIGTGVGMLFAAVPYKDRPIAEIFWLGLRFAWRPKVVLYDRAHRVRIHREYGGEKR